ncbi:MFS transporter [Actinorhabdospora filicis]|uniref:MFS transporter n=1 Tax=Actinorhabdospora filicis TaxID=1785913 RepID=A0A9W6SLT1_9ACTN|nr:MFS transporter [Actinorhabdospora filicis]
MRAGGAATTMTIACVIPVFLVGGLSVQITGDLGFGSSGVGLAVATYFGTSALASIPAGRLVERYGAVACGRAAIALSASSMLTIAAFARGLAALVIILAAGAAANSLGQLASNLLVARHVPDGRQGLLFGLKQAAIPASTLIAGACVPIIALTVGWRWAFVMAGILALTTMIPLRGLPAATPGPKRQDAKRMRPSAGLLITGAAAFCAASAASNITPFLVATAVDHGLSPAAAGLTLTMGSFVGLIARIAVGWFTDRRRADGLLLVTVMLALGSGGLALISATPLWTLPIGVIIGYVFGWSWAGVLTYAVTTTNPEAPAAASGVMQTGVYLGGMAGPFTFGIIAEHHGYAPAWIASGAIMLCAAALTAVARGLLAPGRDRARLHTG